jgi:hypothetical protein
MVASMVLAGCGEDAQKVAPDAGGGQMPPLGDSGSHSTMLYRTGRVDKIDLLLVVDNSASMADKQNVLADAVPDLAYRLINPRCVDSAGAALPVGQQPTSPAAACPGGSKREFDPVADLHIGIVSSSLGGHGADSCSNTPTAQYNERMEDMSHLLTRGTKGKVDTYQGKGFLWWDPTQKKASPPGTADTAALNAAFADIVRGAGQDGCGFESSLEAWYRFLVEPNPYQKMVLNNDLAEPQGLDDTVLRQRGDFLRQDSLVAIVVLTDENDCSVIDGGQMYLALQGFSGQAAFHLPRATSACKSDPASLSCKFCGQPGAQSDPACATPMLTDQEDALNLRCFRQKQRFGIDFLWPVKRYVNALTQATFDDPKVNTGFQAGELNPLFCTDRATDRTRCNKAMRDRNLVFFAGIVGVPWQDVAVDPNDLAKGFRPAAELAWKKSDFDQAGKPAPGGVSGDTTLWDIVLGDPEKYVDPKDPLMVESLDPRTGTNPVTGAALASKDSKSPTENKINGHEWEIPHRDDLQYACIFKLPQDRNCVSNPASCDCSDNPPPKNPVCQKDDGTYDQTQRRAKAYPGLRHLAVLKGAGEQGIVASICPANTEDPNRADYGYRPAVAAIADRLKSGLQARCWDQQPAVGASGEVACVVLEATRGEPSGGTSSCPPCDSAQGRIEPSAQAIADLSQLPTFTQNALQCVCEIPQAATGNDLAQCLSQPDDPPGVNGWCYVDAARSPGANAQLTAHCPASARRLIRFAGLGAPRAGSLVYVSCAL